jgi:chemotaxis protein methyltransferase CheR
VQNLTVGETYFFRDPAVFMAMEEKFLPELARRKRGKKELRIWSAGCSTGEEPYSIAISLLRAIPELNSWSLRLFASDINTRSLEKALAACYGSWSFRTTPEDFLDLYFQSRISGDVQEHVLKERVRKLVQFDYLNLAEDLYPSAKTNTEEMDIIFCRNVLIYFTQQKCKFIADRLSDCLVPGGLLVTSASDSSRFISSLPQGLKRLSTNMFLKEASNK